MVETHAVGIPYVFQVKVNVTTIVMAHVHHVVFHH